jgi:hypothetical protein
VVSKYEAFERVLHGRTDDFSLEDASDSVKKRIAYAFGWNRELDEPSRQKWSSTDNEEAWKGNVKFKRDVLEKEGWFDTEVYYDLNSHGYRDDEFVSSPASIIAMGECFTYGTGIPREMTWPYLLGEELNEKVWNLGLCMTGLDTCFRTLYNWLPVIKPKMVLLLENSSLGREVWSVDESGKEEWNDAIGFWSSVEWQKELVNSSTERFISRQKNLLAVSQLCSINNVELKIISASERNAVGLADYAKNKHKKYALSRDLIHPGLPFHEAMVELWKKEL